MNAGKAFIDTNVLLYLASDDAAKADRAEDILRGGGTISVQVLNEFVSVALRKTALALPDIRDMLAVVRSFCGVVPLDIEPFSPATIWSISTPMRSPSPCQSSCVFYARMALWC